MRLKVSGGRLGWATSRYCMASRQAWRLWRTLGSDTRIKRPSFGDGKHVSVEVLVVGKSRNWVKKKLTFSEFRCEYYHQHDKHKSSIIPYNYNYWRVGSFAVRRWICDAIITDHIPETSITFLTFFQHSQQPVSKGKIFCHCNEQTTKFFLAFNSILSLVPRSFSWMCCSVLFNT